MKLLKTVPCLFQENRRDEADLVVEEEEEDVVEVSEGRKAKGVVRRLRLRGDWSDTGPNARPHPSPPQPTQTSNLLYLS